MKKKDGTSIFKNLGRNIIDSSKYNISNLRLNNYIPENKNHLLEEEVKTQELLAKKLTAEAKQKEAKERINIVDKKEERRNNKKVKKEDYKKYMKDIKDNKKYEDYNLDLTQEHFYNYGKYVKKLPKAFINRPLYSVLEKNKMLDTELNQLKQENDTALENIKQYVRNEALKNVKESGFLFAEPKGVLKRNFKFFCETFDYDVGGYNVPNSTTRQAIDSVLNITNQMKNNNIKIINEIKNKCNNIEMEMLNIAYAEQVNRMPYMANNKGCVRNFTKNLFNDHRYNKFMEEISDAKKQIIINQQCATKSLENLFNSITLV